MFRGRATLIAALLVVGTLGLTAGTAQAQDYPGPPPAPGASCTVDATVNAALVANAVVDIRVSCTLIVAGRTYTGILASTPVALPATVAEGNGAITFRGVRLPADFETNHSHMVSLVDQATGITLGTDTIFVDKNGRITAAPKSNLPKTGSNSTDPFLKGGAALVALGGVALMVSRRRKASATTAV